MGLQPLAKTVENYYDHAKSGAVQRYGDLHIHSGSQCVDQWHPKYLSQVFPFAIPCMDSGLEYDTEHRWRRNNADASAVTQSAFTKGLARRVGAHWRNDWSLVHAVANRVFQQRKDDIKLPNFNP